MDSATGLGTYHAYVDGANLKVDFIPTATGIGTTGAINTYKLVLLPIILPDLDLLI